MRNLSGVTDNHQIGISVTSRNRSVVLRLDERGDCACCGAGIVGARTCIIDVYIVAFLELPFQPTVKCSIALESRIAYHQHLDRCVIEVRMVAINVCNSSIVEQLCIDWFESRAVSPQQHVLGSYGIGTVEAHFHLDVVEHTDLVVHWVVAHRLDGHLTKLHATHGAFHADDSRWLALQTTC